MSFNADRLMGALLGLVPTVGMFLEAATTNIKVDTALKRAKAASEGIEVPR